MSVVFYKFKSAKDYDQAVFDGLGISVFDLKKEIMVKKKLGKGLDFDLVVSNAQTNDEYPDDNQVIPRNTSILVLRRPAAKHGRGTASRYVGGVGSVAAAPIATSTSSTGGGFSSGFSVNTGGLFGQHSTPSDNAAADAGPELTEEERMQQMFKNQEEQITKQQDEMVANRPQGAGFGNRGGFSRGGAGGSFRGGRGGGETGGSETWGGHSSHYMNRPLPPGYVCFRCGKQGHHIAQCPTIGDINYDRPKLKKTTGIPKMFLKEIDEKESGLGTANGPEGGLMVSQSGKIVVATTNDDAWTKLSSTARSFGGVGDVHKMAPVLPEFKCSLCSKNMKNAVQAPCCNISFCDDCIEEQLRDGTPQFQCPSCRQELFPDTLRPNAALRASIDRYLKSYVVGSTSGKSPSLTEGGGGTGSNDISRTQSPSLDGGAQQPSYTRPRPYTVAVAGGSNTSNTGNVSAIPVLTSDNNNAGGNPVQNWAGGMINTGYNNNNYGGRGGYNNNNNFNAHRGGYQNMGRGGRGGYINNNVNYGNNMYGNNMYGNQMGMMGNQMWMNGNQMGYNMGNEMMGYGGGGGGRAYNYGGGNYSNNLIDANGKRKREDDDEKPPGE
ncbi:UNVERIFIED_CONTAM: hypothetical protein HDU68_002382 [Siphonaria sp. JEL0065]|nr:hypothetical protein HDU68_002382 [Siphonaria sp. JEL0065]